MLDQLHVEIPPEVVLPRREIFPCQALFIRFTVPLPPEPSGHRERRARHGNGDDGTRFHGGDIGVGWIVLDATVESVPTPRAPAG
jgi:hypothetical protein